MTEMTSASRRDFLKGAAVVGGLAALTAGSSLAAPEDAFAATKKIAAGAQDPKVGVYGANAIVKANAKWELIHKFAPGENRMVEGPSIRPNHPNELWFIDIGFGAIYSIDLKTKGYPMTNHMPAWTPTGDNPWQPNGARWIDENTLLVADRGDMDKAQTHAAGLYIFDVEKSTYTPLEVEFYDYFDKHEKKFPNAGPWGIAHGEEPKGFDVLNDLVLAGDGTHAYVTDPGASEYLNPTGRVWYVDYSGYKEGKAAACVWARGLKYPNGITISAANPNHTPGQTGAGEYLYVAEFNTNSIIAVPTVDYCQRKILDTPFVVARLTGGHGPDGVLTDSKNNIYAAHLHAKEIAVVDTQGRPVRNIKLPYGGGSDSSNLCISADGYLYITDFQNVAGDDSTSTYGGGIWRIKTSAKPNPLTD